jgi:hypothetical protein
MQQLAVAYPFAGFALAGRLKNLGWIAEAKDLLQALLGDAIKWTPQSRQF